MGAGEIDSQPGFRRRFVVTPAAGRVTAAVEDDYHCMAVTLCHDGATVQSVEAVMNRAPWTTCPGAEAMVTTTFTGVALVDAARRGDKKLNCTHLHDLALLAAAHAGDIAPTRYALLVSDPVNGRVVAEIRREGTLVLRIVHTNDIVETPAEIAGTSLFQLRDWIGALDSAEAREAARLLQWGAIIAHGRAMPLENQSDASRMPANCFTFQPDMKTTARRVGRIVDFSQGGREPLDHFDGGHFR